MLKPNEKLNRDNVETLFRDVLVNYRKRLNDLGNTNLVFSKADAYALQTMLDCLILARELIDEQDID